MTKPFIKWAGGKRALLPQILEQFPSTYGDYYEPFLGGGAVFFGLEPPGIAYLSDANRHLINAYRAVRDCPEQLISFLSDYHSNEAFYYAARSRDPDSMGEVEAAARFIFLNKTCFNGLYRVNRKGAFNVPFGKYKNPTICDEEAIHAASKDLVGTTLACKTAFSISPEAGDLVYCDPPYDGTFASYTEEGFGEDEQVQLAAWAFEQTMRDVNVVLSNADTELVRSLYAGFEFIEVERPRGIGEKAKELIIVGCVG